MSGSFDLVINGKTVKANYGETLIDAGLSGWVAIPHDCCSGQCETCRVTVVSGQVDDRGTADKGTVLACQAKVIGNAEIAFDHVPEVAKRSGVVTGIAPLAPDIVEVVVALASPIEYRAGQYFSVKFSGFPGARSQPHGAVRRHGRPGRAGVPHPPLSGRARLDPDRRHDPARPSRAGARPVRAGVPARGRRPDRAGRRAAPAGRRSGRLRPRARREQRHRDLVVIAGARDAEGLYMRRSLDWLIDDGVREIITTAETGAHNPVLPGRPTHYLPSLGPEDTVYVAGPPPLVDAVKIKSRAPARAATPIRSCRTPSRCR